MADSPPDSNGDSEPTHNGAVRMSLPTVLCSSEESTEQTLKTLMASESKLSLPSNLDTPTSPLKISSPLSLPTSPTPFLKKTSGLQTPISSKPSLLLTSTTTNVAQMKNNAVNTGSATGNSRNKCALQPGHSLMDWIRLGNSGKDLTGVGGRIRAVSPKELSAHNTLDDAWIAIRGRVYNVTHYMPYHPGGPEELMRGAGIDATEIFNKVHPWVNYDSLLAKCLVGPLRDDRPDAEEFFGSNNPSPKSDKLREPSKAQELVRKSMENLANCITPVRKKITAKTDDNVKTNPSKIMQSLIQSSDLPVTISRRAGSSPSRKDEDVNKIPAPLRFDWIQTSTKLTLSVYTGPLANPGGCARLLDNVLLLEVATDGYLRTLKLVPEQTLREPIQLRVYTESGKIELCAHKAEASIWHSCGEIVASAAAPVSSPRSLDCTVRKRERVSHDTVLLTLAPKNGFVVVPLGHHIRVHFRIDGEECVRSYTPIGEGWGDQADVTDSSTLRLAIKRYPTGTLSPHLTDLDTSDTVTLSGPYGNFKLNKLKNVKTINLIAAGTGITPMLGLLKFMLSRSKAKCEKVKLLFFNKKEEDILFKQNLETIAKEDNRFTAIHVLSEANSSWTGRTGRINSDILSSLGKSIQCDERCTNFACICGPAEFTQLAYELLLKLRMKEDCVHTFMG